VTDGQSGKAVARTGLRMMPTFPLPPLKFRTVGSPQYGFKASLSDRACPGAPEVKPTPGIPSELAWFASVLRADHGYTTVSSRQVALTGSPEQSSPRATPLRPTGPWLRKGYAVPSLFATTTRSASLAGTRGLHGVRRLYRGPSLGGSARGDPRDLPYFSCRAFQACRRPYAGESASPSRYTLTPRYQALSRCDRVATHHPVSASNTRRVSTFDAASFASCYGPPVCPALLAGYDEMPPEQRRLAFPGTVSLPLLTPSVAVRRWESS
jgi:hypothetical protein